MRDRTSSRSTVGWLVLIVVVSSSLAGLAATGPRHALPSGVAPSPPSVLSGTPRLAPAPSGTPSDSHHPPGEITSGMGWEGLDYRNTCSGCLPANPQLAVGGGYVLEFINGSEAIWLVNGSEVHNETLGALFGTGNDSLDAARVQFDLFSDRWFIATVDVTTRELLLGSSLSSDPTAEWNLQSTTPANGSVARDPQLAVDAVAVALTADVYSPNGTFLGAQVWAANKSSLVADQPTPIVALDAPDPATEGLVPADPLSSASTLYLVDDGVGGNNSLREFSLTGAPPGNATLSSPSNFISTTSPPPDAVQAGSTNLLAVGDGRVVSAAWRSGSLWAVATGGCTPANDTAARSCLHVWEVDTTTNTLLQDFTWSTGAGTYDFDPALSIATRGDVALVFGESSATLDPSFFATGQAVSGPSGTLVAPVSLHTGSGPYTPPIGCTGGVCPFGDVFAIASTPSTNVHFWAVGEYAPQNSSKNFYKTWVNQVAAWATVPVTFAQSGLPGGTPWSVTVNGELYATSNSSITVDEQNGSYTYTLLAPIAGSPGIRYQPTVPAGTFSVSSPSVQVSVAYLAEYELSTSAGPTGEGAVYPSGNWFEAGATVSLSALANAGYAFEGWSGSGAGSYSGTNNPAGVTIVAPIVEQAQFWASATYPVAFTATGLSLGSNWTVTVNGLSNGSTQPTIVFNEPNGSYTYAVSSPVPGTTQTVYLAIPAAGSFRVAGTSASVQVAYTPEFELSASSATPGTGVVNPSGGWYLSGTSVNLSALAEAGELFVGWSGAGAGSYTGSANPAPVAMNSPVSEVARFAPATTYVVTYSESGLPNGASWTVATNGVHASSTGSTIVFNEPNGSYTYGAQTSFTGANGTAYTASPAFGAFVVAGGPLHEAVLFAPIAPKSSTPGTESAASGMAGIPFWVFGAVLAALLIVVAILAYASRRPPEAPPAPEPTVAPPRPAWDESS